LALALTAAVSAQQNLAVEPADGAAIAGNIYSLVQEHFAHWESAPRADVDRAYRQYLAAIVATQTREAFELSTLRFIAQLHNGHTQFFGAALNGRPLKFRLLEVEGRWAVVASGDRRLPVGAVVRTLDGEPVEEFVRSRARYVHASNERLARTHVFSYPGLFPERISLGLQDGRTVVIDRREPADVAAPVLVTEGRWLEDGRIAYIRVPSFANPEYEGAAVALVRRFESSPALIVDVRRNGGGATPGRLIAALMDRPWRGWRQIVPARDSRAQDPIESAYAGRMFVLVDRFCGSACEDFVMPFKDTRRATLVGETTQGSSGNPHRASVGPGLTVSVGAVRYRFPDGSPFEGVGIAPDVDVRRRLADVAAGRDAVLARALELAGGR
jgi:carboxyl-terminal processing protease